MQEGIQDINAAGLNVIAISYDSQEVLQKFAENADITFPLLSDSTSKVIEHFGLLNTGGRKGTRHEGISHPMTVLVDSNRVVTATIPGTVRERHGVEALLDAWKELDPDPAAEESNGTEDSWSQLRGENQGHANEGMKLPTVWTEQDNVAWKTAIPGNGWSSPIVDGDEIWLTTSIDDQKSLRAICVDLNSGEIRLNIEVFKPTQFVEKHARNGHATPTPVLDEKHVYVHFGSYGTAALNRKDGSIVWTNQDTVIQHQWGPGSSPVLFDDMLVFNCDGMDLRYVIALDKATGEPTWKTDRSVATKDDGFFRKAFSTPLVANVNDTPMLLSAGANQFSALNTDNGEEVWNAEFFGYAGVTVPIAANGRAFVTSGYGDGSLMAVQLDDSDDFKSGEVIWKTNQNAPIIPTPIVVGDELYMVSDNGIFTCLDAESGTMHWRKRLQGNYASSILFGDGKLFISSDRGVTHVVKPSKSKMELLASNELDSNIQATAALSNDSIIMRTKNSLYRLMEK